MGPRRIAILLFPDVDALDLAGPYEVFTAAGRRRGMTLFEVFTVGEKPDPILAQGGLCIQPKHTTESCPPFDILLVPGGPGTRREIHNPALIAWIRDRAQSVEIVLSVCTGALLLAKAGVLDGLRATTHHLWFHLLSELAPTAIVCPENRFVDNGHVVTSAGVSAGIDMSLHIVARLLDEEVARETAAQIEYATAAPSVWLSSQSEAASQAAR
jgi:transcriptional regulator GlxA family with amidase domain